MKRDVQIRQAPLNVDLIYFSKRADSGNAHSKENPSFVAGAAGGCGSVWLEPDACIALRFDDFVSRPIASTVSAGGRHGRRFIARRLISSVASPAPQQSGLQAFYGIASGMARPSQNHAKVADASSF